MNTTFTINSVTFSKYLSKSGYIHISVKVNYAFYLFIKSNSAKHESIKILYERKLNFCVFSEILNLVLNRKINDELLIFEINWTEVEPLIGSQSLGKKTYHAVELFE